SAARGRSGAWPPGPGGRAGTVAHRGPRDYEPFLALAERYERGALDTPMAFTPFFERLPPFPARALPRLQALGLAGKVLLGSDFPNIPYPYAEQIAGLARLGLGEPWLRAVCWDNAARLFALPGGAS